MCDSYLFLDVVYMRGVVEEFHHTYKTLFPDETTKAKGHYTVHYPSQTLLFGPLVHCWTIRLEGKHEYFKGIFHRTKNRKNICKTMAERHQRRQTLLHKSTCFFGPQFVESSVRTTEFVLFLPREVQLLVAPHIGKSEVIVKVKKIAGHGITYMVGLCVVIGHHNGSLLFGEITDIFSLQGEYYLCCQQMTTVDYSRHYHAFMLVDSGVFVLEHVTDLINIHPIVFYKANNQKHVLLRHHIPIPLN